MAPTVTSDQNVGANGILRITIDQSSQNAANNTSQVRVRGVVINDGTTRSFHNTVNISASITGYGSYTGSYFSFDLDAGEYKVYIDHTFTVHHDGSGNATVSFTVHFGATGTNTFGDNGASGATLSLTRIGFPPSSPGRPNFSAVNTTSMTVTWTASTNNGGIAIKSYLLRRWAGLSMTGSYVDNSALNLTRNLTGLTPGVVYTFAVYALNNAGYSNPGTSAQIQTLGGAWVRYGKTWHRAIPYVRVNKVWKPAYPYIRSGGTWHNTS
jgi:hypothetical protein